MSPTDLRVRFAPSPTGYLHVGGVRTALFNWLYARQRGGTYLVRIEDTDRQRSTPEAMAAILEGLEWLGLTSDEPLWYQSEHRETHREVALDLLARGWAYRDFATAEEGAARRREARAGAAVYRSPDRDRPAADSDDRAAAGHPFVVRFKVPEGDRAAVSFEDAVFGPQSKPTAAIEDFVLLRTDGTPVYNLGVVCDDHHMGITDVIRGQDHLANTFKQILIYEAMEWPLPTFAHLPLILAPDRSKLSKRKHGEVVSVRTYQEGGLLPEPFLNFIALLGWSPGDDREIFSLNELIEAFSLENVSRSNAVFNFHPGDPRRWTDPKALHMNGQYLSRMPLGDLVPLVRERLVAAGFELEEFASDWIERLVDALRPRCFTLVDFVDAARPYLDDTFPIDPKAARRNLKDQRLRTWLPQLADRLDDLPTFDADRAEEALRGLAAELDLRPGLLINATRTILTGQIKGPGIFDVMLLLGRDRCIGRLRRAADLWPPPTGAD